MTDDKIEAYFLWDGNEWTEYASRELALDDADAAIEAARDCCDPLWPVWTDEIAVYAACAGCDEPEEAGRLVAHAKGYEIPVPPGYEDLDVDCWWNYEMVEAGE